MTTPRTDRERIRDLETDVAELRAHSMETYKLIVSLSVVVAKLTGIPPEKIDQIIEKDNQRIISKLHGNN